MPIRAVCECGKSYQAPDARAGRSFKCVSCGATVSVPDGKPGAGRPPAGAPGGKGIEIRCACGKVLTVPASWAGKRGRCKACGAPLRIPGGEPPAPAARPPAAVPPPLKIAEDDHPHCPNCGRRVQKEDVLCVGCGTNLKTGVTLAVAGPETPPGRPPWLIPAIAGGALVLLVGLYLGFTALFGSKPPTDTGALARPTKRPPPPEGTGPPPPPPEDPAASKEVIAQVQRLDLGRTEAEDALARILLLDKKGIPELKRQAAPGHRDLSRIYASGALAIQKELSALAACLEAAELPDPKAPGAKAADPRLRYPALRMLFLAARRCLVPTDDRPLEHIAKELQGKGGGFVEASPVPPPSADDLQQALSRDRPTQDLAIFVLSRVYPKAGIERSLDPGKQEEILHKWQDFFLQHRPDAPETPDLSKEIEADIARQVADLAGADATKVDEALRNLVWFGPKAYPPLLDAAFAKGPDPTRQRIVRARVAEVLQKAPRDPDLPARLADRMLAPGAPPEDAETAEEILRELGDASLSLRVAEGILRKDLPDDRAERWIGLLQKWGGTGVSKTLEPGLASPDPTVRRHALGGLKAVGDLSSAPSIAKLLQAGPDKTPLEPDWEIRRQALDVLGVLGMVAEGRGDGAAAAGPLSDARKPVAGALEEDPQAAVRAAAALTLGRIGSPDDAAPLVKALEACLKSPNPVVVRSAAEGIGQLALRHRSSAGAIRQRAGRIFIDLFDGFQREGLRFDGFRQSKDIKTREALVAALGAAGGRPASIERLAKILEKEPSEADDDFWVRASYRDRIAAAQALSEASDASVMDPLIRTLRNRARRPAHLSEARELRRAALDSLRALTGHDPLAKNAGPEGIDLGDPARADDLYAIWNGWWNWLDRRSHVRYDEAKGRFVLDAGILGKAVGDVGSADPEAFRWASAILEEPDKGFLRLGPAIRERSHLALDEAPANREEQAAKWRDWWGVYGRSGRIQYDPAADCFTVRTTP